MMLDTRRHWWLWPLGAAALFGTYVLACWQLDKRGVRWKGRLNPVYLQRLANEHREALMLLAKHDGPVQGRKGRP